MEQEETLDTVTFKSQPFKLGKSLTVRLDKLNEELAKYKLRVDTLDDIYFDKELTELNECPVLKINMMSTDNSDDQVWDVATEDWFFNGVHELENKFESETEVFSSAEFDRLEYIMTLKVNTENKKLTIDKKLLATGGAAAQTTSVDYDLRESIAAQIDLNPLAVFAKFGIQAHTSPDDYQKKKQLAIDKSIEEHNARAPKPIIAFFQGKKINLASGALLDTVDLQKAIAEKVMENMQASLNTPVNPDYLAASANQKAVIIIDIFAGKFKNAAAEGQTTPFCITSDMIDENIELLNNTSPHKHG
jgi:hypothetical protein